MNPALNPRPAASVLTLDISNCFTSRIGSTHGLTPDALKSAAANLSDLTVKLDEMDKAGQTRWRQLALPGEFREGHVQAVKEIVANKNAYFESNCKDKCCEHLIVLGIGGSALGNIAVHNALKEHVHNLTRRERRIGPRMYVLDNVDPYFVGDLMAHLEVEDPGLTHTMVNVISKSGETAETAAQFMIFRQWLKDHLGPERYRTHIVAVTDPGRGTMRSIVDDEGYDTLPVPDGVGGRFSVLSPVGLFSAAMCGIDIDTLLDGAAAMDARCRHKDPMKNPAAVLGWMLMTLAMSKGKINHVLMPYANELYSLADWFRQLWAESLGKRVDVTGREVFAGATPIKALGTTDQHSQVQLYREGPNDKVIGFINVANWRRDVKVPDTLKVDAISYLHHKSLGELIHAEKRATEYALCESERPNYTINMPAISAFHVGEFIQMWEVATAYAGLILNIDTYNQPAVETGKVATFGLMGRTGYGEWKSKVEKKLTGAEMVI